MRSVILVVGAVIGLAVLLFGNNWVPRALPILQRRVQSMSGPSEAAFALIVGGALFLTALAFLYASVSAFRTTPWKHSAPGATGQPTKAVGNPLEHFDGEKQAAVATEHPQSFTPRASAASRPSPRPVQSESLADAQAAPIQPKPIFKLAESKSRIRDLLNGVDVRIVERIDNGFLTNVTRITESQYRRLLELKQSPVGEKLILDATVTGTYTDSNINNGSLGPTTTEPLQYRINLTVSDDLRE